LPFGRQKQVKKMNYPLRILAAIILAVLGIGRANAGQTEKMRAISALTPDQ
jgi:hypothetical protein